MLDFDRYKFTKDCDHPDWLMDDRHIEVMHEFVMNCDLDRVIEIGCYSGYSTIALIEAINKGKKFKLHLSEYNVTKQLKTLISMCKHPDQVILHTQKSKHVLEKWTDFDLAVIDGDHSVKGAGTDLLFILRHSIPNVFAHDTNVYAFDQMQHPCLGAELIHRTLSNHREYSVFEDSKERESELTHRGLFFASSSDENWLIAKSAYEKFCDD